MIVDEARPLSGFVPTHADFLRDYAFVIMKLHVSKLPSLRVIRALFASQSTFGNNYKLLTFNRVFLTFLLFRTCY